MDDSHRRRYEPEPDFKEDKKDPLVDIELMDSTELWLIQWPLNELKPSDFHGKELSLKLHHDGRLGSFESSAGKTYDVLSYAAQEPDATVFLPSSLGSKVVGKISRRVSLVRYPDPAEYDTRSASNLNPSSQRSEGSWRKGMSRRSGTDKVSRDTLTSTHSMGQRSEETLQRSRHKRREESSLHSDESMKSAERSSRASLGSEQSRGEKSKKKKKVKVED